MTATNTAPSASKKRLGPGRGKGLHDLVEVSPEAKPPVDQASMDYGKYKYEQQKKAAEGTSQGSRRSSKIKEIKMRPTIDDHDYEREDESDEALLRRWRHSGEKSPPALQGPRNGAPASGGTGPALNRVQKDTEVFAKLENGIRRWKDAR